MGAQIEIGKVAGHERPHESLRANVGGSQSADDGWKCVARADVVDQHSDFQSLAMRPSEGVDEPAPEVVVAENISRKLNA